MSMPNPAPVPVPTQAPPSPVVAPTSSGGMPMVPTPAPVVVVDKAADKAAASKRENALVEAARKREELRTMQLSVRMMKALEGAHTTLKGEKWLETAKVLRSLVALLVGDELLTQEQQALWDAHFVLLSLGELSPPTPVNPTSK